VEFMIVIIILALFGALAAGAADSRDGNDWVNHGRV
jgi:hypothetical protein